MMFCPNCGELKVKSSDVDSQEQYYENTHWKKTEHKCTVCFASFLNFDNGMEARDKKKRQDETDLAEYERLKIKFGEVNK